MKARKVLFSLLFVMMLCSISASVFASETTNVANQTALEAALSDSSVTNITLTEDIELTGKWIPATINSNRTLVINGNGKTISNMVVRNYSIESDGSGVAGTGSSCDYRAGFIGTNQGNLTIENLVFANADVDMDPLSTGSTGSSQVAVVCGYNSGTLVFNDVEVNSSTAKAYNKVAAFVGHADKGSFVANNCAITDTTITLEADGTDPEASFAGIVVGYNKAQTTKTNGVKITNSSCVQAENVLWADYEVQTAPNSGATYVVHSTNGTYGLVSQSYKKDEEAFEAVQFEADIDGYQYETLADAINNASGESVIKLLLDIKLSEKVVIDSGKSLTIDLNGTNLTATCATAFEVRNGCLTISDTSDEKGAISVNGEAFRILGRETTSGKVIIEKDIVVESSNDCCVYIIGKGATLISAGELTTKGGNYATIQGNGNSENGGIEVYINGGSVSHANDVAIYFPNTSLLEVTDGVISGAMAIYQKSGKLTITGGKFEAFGPKADYKFNGNGCGITGDAIIVESCDYPGGVPEITITSGEFSSLYNQAVASYVGNGVSDSDRIVGFISGGYFTSNPIDFLVEGKVVTASDKEGYSFMVVDKKDEISMETESNSKLPEVEVLEGILPEGVTLSGEFAANNEVLEEEATALLNDSTIIGSQEEIIAQISGEIAIDNVDNVRVVMQPYIDVVLNDYEESGDSKVLTLDISAKYDLIATIAIGEEEIITKDGEDKNAVVMKEGAELPVTTSIKLRIALPTDFATEGTIVYVNHIKETQTYTYESQVKVDESGELYIEFDNPHGFSVFEVKTEIDGVAINENTYIAYVTLEEAIANVENNETIKLLADNSETVTVNKDITFTLNKAGNSFSGDIIAGSNTKVEKTEDSTNDSIIYTFDYTVPSSGGSGTSYYTVKFVTNGGTEIKNVKVKRNESIEKPTSPEKEGYTFEGWYTNEACTEEYDFANKVKNSFSLYAKWNENEVEDWKNPFVDVNENNWFFDSVKYVHEKGIVKGMSDTEFGPNVAVTRGMMVTLLYRLSGATTTKVATFDDVNKNAYYSNAIAWAAEMGIVNGVGDNKFAPDTAITREQLATMMFRYMEKMEIDIPALLIEYPAYDDAEEISAYAVTSVKIMRNTGLMQGKLDNRFDPKGTALRSEVATLLMRFCEVK